MIAKGATIAAAVAATGAAGATYVFVPALRPLLNQFFGGLFNFKK